MQLCFFFKQKTAYGMRISDWSSDVCSSDLVTLLAGGDRVLALAAQAADQLARHVLAEPAQRGIRGVEGLGGVVEFAQAHALQRRRVEIEIARSEERSVWYEGVCTCRSGGAPHHYT